MTGDRNASLLAVADALMNEHLDEFADDDGYEVGWRDSRYGVTVRDAIYDALASSSASGAAWRPIQTVPMDETVILANFTNRCLLTGAPHVWTATYVTKWQNLAGADAEGDPQWCECSFAAMNENGEPTHWMPLSEWADEASAALATNSTVEGS